jgi:hypothetical protein
VPNSNDLCSERRPSHYVSSFPKGVPVELCPINYNIHLECRFPQDSLSKVTFCTASQTSRSDAEPFLYHTMKAAAVLLEQIHVQKPSLYQASRYRTTYHAHYLWGDARQGSDGDSENSPLKLVPPAPTTLQEFRIQAPYSSSYAVALTTSPLQCSKDIHFGYTASRRSDLECLAQVPLRAA